MQNFWVNGIVAARNQTPYVQLSNENGMICQLSMAQARQVANDILLMASRTEADAMILRFFDKLGLPRAACAQLLTGFRDFRMELDQDVDSRPAGGDPTGGFDPETGEKL